LGEALGREGVPEEPFEVEEAVLAEALDAAAEGGQAGAELRKERRVHDKYLYLSRLDVQAKLSLMKTTAAARGSLPPAYRRLRQRLARIGYISQGSVLDRSTLRPPRSGYQWTRKVGQKTLTVSLSRPQYDALRCAVENERTLWGIVEEMEKLSRQILFETLPDTRRRSRRSKEVEGHAMRLAVHSPTPHGEFSNSRD